MVKIEIVRTETIKPSSPTPDGLRRFSLSVFDQLIPDVYTPVLLFYPAGGQSCHSDRIRKLKQSLSEALVRFYPVAGTLVKADHHVDCDDRGVDFVEAKVQGCRLSDILGRPDNNILGKLLPAQNGARKPLMLVQANLLECGGAAIAVRLNHVLMDACAMSAFLKCWAAEARGDAPPHTPDLNVIASRFPAILTTIPPPVGPGEACEVRTRRFVFQASKIAALRDKISRAGTERPTRVAALSALVWKCMMNALTKRPGHETRPSIVSQALNLRTRVEPPVSENSLGNMVVPIIIAESGGRNELQHLAGQLSQGLRDTTRNVTMSRDLEEARTIIYEGVKNYPTWFGRKDLNFYMLASWCRFGWYELDFGWGGPAWISSVHYNVKNLILMTDTRDGGGIEVLATLSEQDMIFFETDPELLEFCTVNPSVFP